MPELFGGFAGTIVNPLVALCTLSYALLLRRAVVVRGLAVATAMLLAWIEVRPLLSTTALAACLGAAVGGLLMAELWLSVVLPTARAGMRLLLLLAAELMSPRAPPSGSESAKRD
jgi:hypothetical protein